MQASATIAAALRRRYPEQLAVVVAREAGGKCNPIAVAWAMPTSEQPPMIAIAIGKGRYSAGVIRSAGAFVVAYPSPAQAGEVLHFGTRSGADEDKLAERGTPTQCAARIDCVLLREAVANFECALRHEYPAGDHLIFVGEIVAAHVHSDASLARLCTIAHETMGSYPLGK